MLKFISFLFLSSFLSKAWGYESFNDLPLNIPNGEFMIHATLTDPSSREAWFIEEFVHSSTYKQGKISITSQTGPVNVYYNTKSRNQRLVIEDYDCNLFTYNYKWDKKITGVTKSLVNHILLVGPSLIYRLLRKPFPWTMGNDTEVRGTTMQTASTSIGSTRLNITYFYKNYLDSSIGLEQPSRIIFDGYDPSDTSSSSVRSTLILDIYLQMVTSEELDKITIPQPGIGCPIYFTSSGSYFNLVWDSIHYISDESVIGSVQMFKRNEIYADERKELLSLKTTSQGVTSYAIYDYKLGLIYVLVSGTCLVNPMSLRAPGVSHSYMHKGLEINALLDATYSFKYLGQSWFENRPGLIADVWESVDFNQSIGAYDDPKYAYKFAKVVTTFYTVDSKNGDTNSGRIPIGSVISGYNQGVDGKYKLVETTTKYFYDFGQEISEEEYNIRFKISDCYQKSSDRKTLAIKYTCESSNCERAVEKYSYSFREKIRTSIINSGTISASRISNIDIVFDSNSTTAFVTFLNFPDISKAFQSEYKQLSSVKGTYVTKAESEKDCLKLSASTVSFNGAVVYCTQSQTCSVVVSVDSLVEDSKGEPCFVYSFPLGNLNRYNRESKLENLQQDLSKSLSFYFWDNFALIRYSISRVDEVITAEDKSRQLYYKEQTAFKLVEDGINTVMATNAHSLADCYRACANHDDNKCETFSFCQHEAKTECLLSTSVYANITDKRTYDSDCGIFRKNRLDDYIRIRNRKFTHATSVSTDHYLEDCADLCYDSAECFAFQICGLTCTFGGYYTEASTSYTSNCDIYIPKLTQKYAPSGKKIVAETYHTELDLTLDQCAALCYDLKMDGSNCVSFNYCPKGVTKSSCSLSKYSVKSASTQTNDTDVCTNYELIDDQSSRSRRQNSNKRPVNGTTAVEAFGTIILFIVVGLTVGLVGPFIYNKAQSLVNNWTSAGTETFNWSRHTNEDDDQIQSTI